MRYLLVLLLLSACSVSQNIPRKVQQSADPFLEFKASVPDGFHVALSLAYFDASQRDYRVLTPGVTGRSIGHQNYGCNEHGCRRVEKLDIFIPQNILEDALLNGFTLNLVTRGGDLDDREILAVDVRYALRRFGIDFSRLRSHFHH